MHRSPGSKKQTKPRNNRDEEIKSRIVRKTIEFIENTKYKITTINILIFHLFFLFYLPTIHIYLFYLLHLTLSYSIYRLSYIYLLHLFCYTLVILFISFYANFYQLLFLFTVVSDFFFS